MKKVGIIGGAGYAAGELLRLLVNHPQADIAFVHSSSSAGRPLSEVHPGLEGDTQLCFSADHDLESIDLLFLCTPHGAARRFWQRTQRPESLRVIDLSQDFRDESQGYVYGLPEVNAARIAEARSVANPGCFATCLQLATVPLAAAGILDKNRDVNITAITGATGAGVTPSPSTHFSWRTGNMSVYKPFSHQHLDEIRMTLSLLQPEGLPAINFVPMRGDFARGIFAVVTMRSDLSQRQAADIFESYYADAPFAIPSPGPIHLKQVVNTNKAIMHVEKHGDMLMVTCAIDNLLKGAAGQAVQNMNLMWGLDQRTGLRLKASAF